MGALGKSADVQAAIAQGGSETLRTVSAALAAGKRPH